MCKLILYGQPYSKIRPRIHRKGKFISMYDPQEGEKKAVKTLMISYCKHNDIQALKGAVSFKSIHYFLPPKSTKGIKLNKKLWNESLTTEKPDIDNVLKFYLDCANTIFFDDDSQVIHCKAYKKYSHIPRSEIIIEEIAMKEIEEEDKKIIYMFTPKELQDFSDDCKSIGGYFEDSISMGEEGIGPIWASTAASLLTNFTNKWFSKLKKIGKK